MTNESPFDTARKIRAYGDALARQDILAREIEYDASRLNLPQADAADTFFRRRNGTPRCEHQTQADPPNPALPRRRRATRHQLLRRHRRRRLRRTHRTFPHDPRLLPTARRRKRRQPPPAGCTPHPWPTPTSTSKQQLLQLQLARRLIRNFHSTNPAPYPNPGESDTPSDIPSSSHDSENSVEDHLPAAPSPHLRRPALLRRPPANADQQATWPTTTHAKTSTPRHSPWPADSAPTPKPSGATTPLAQEIQDELGTNAAAAALYFHRIALRHPALPTPAQPATLHQRRTVRRHLRPQPQPAQNRLQPAPPGHGAHPLRTRRLTRRGPPPLRRKPPGPPAANPMQPKPGRYLRVRTSGHTTTTPAQQFPHQYRLPISPRQTAMNAETLPPFRLAQLLRQLADARERNHPIAVDIAAAGPLPDIAAALWVRTPPQRQPPLRLPTSTRHPTLHRRRLRRRHQPRPKQRPDIHLLPRTPPPLPQPRTVLHRPRLQQQPPGPTLRLLPPGRPASAAPVTLLRPLPGPTDPIPRRPHHAPPHPIPGHHLHQHGDH